jgi:hypothetical protein
VDGGVARVDERVEGRRRKRGRRMVLVVNMVVMVIEEICLVCVCIVGMMMKRELAGGEGQVIYLDYRYMKAK